MMSRRVVDDEQISMLSGPSSQPLLLTNGDDENNSSDDASPASASKVRYNFLYMSTLFALNHGCTVSCLGLANARLGSIGVWQSGVLYASYTVAALFGASYFVKRFGSRNGLALGMGMSASYVTSFFLASLIVEKNGQWVWLRDFVAIAGALVGGLGSSILWVGQGTYFSCASQLFASKEGERLEDVTSRFGGDFAFIFLAFEVILRLLSTSLIETAGLSWEVIFGLYSLLSILPTIFIVRVLDLERYQNFRNGTGDNDSDERSPLHKATAASDLLRHDPKTKYLSPVCILFGLSTAFSSSVLNGEVIKKVLSDPNSTFVGLYTAITSMVAAVASLMFGRLQSSQAHGDGRLHCGKEEILSIGALSYLVIALQFLAFADGSDWNRVTLLSVYILLGIGRATYEGTLRSVFADFFPNEKEGAFANIILFSGTASTLGYILGVTGALHCKEISKYCMKYSDDSIHDVFVMEIVIIATAIIAIPSFWRAVWMFRKEQDNQHV